MEEQSFISSKMQSYLQSGPKVLSLLVPLSMEIQEICLKLLRDVDSTLFIGIVSLPNSELFGSTEL